MLVSEQRCDHSNPKPGWPWQREARGQPPQQPPPSHVHGSRVQQRARNPESLWDREQARATVVINVLACVQHVKAANPQRDRRAKNQYAQIESASDGDPRGRRRDSQSKTKKQMRPVRKALSKGVEKKNRQRDWRQLQCQPIELPSRD